MMSKLTACLVSANRPIELKKAIDSLANQSYKEFDVILSDDSKDPSIRDYFLSKFPKGKYFHHSPPLGEIKNTNFIIKSAQTDYVVLCHDDDYLAPSYFEDCFLRMVEMPEIDLAYSGRIIVDPKDRVLTLNLMRNTEPYFTLSAKKILGTMLYNERLSNYRVPINTPGLFFKKNHFLKVGGLNPKVNTHCDTEFLLKILSITRKILFVNKAIYYSKLWNHSSGRSKSSEKCEVFEAELGVLEYFCDYKSDPPFTDLQKKRIFKEYAIRCCNFNGPMLWMALRSKLGFIETNVAITSTAIKLVKLNSSVLFIPKFYVNLIASLIVPQKILVLLQQYYTIRLNTKS